MTAQVAAGAGGMDVDLNRDVFMGHEFSAEVLEAGPDTETHPPGTLVTSIPVLLSAKGVEPIVYSNSTIGGYAERMLLSAPLLLPIPNGLDLKHAALTEPMAVGLHAVNKSNIAPGETALVLGCGPIGIAIIAALRARGVETIVASDFSPKRRELATAMGAHQTLDAAQGSPFDTVKPAVVFEAVGVPGIIDDVLRRARPGTRLVVAGVCMQPDTVHPFFAIAKEINVQFVARLQPGGVRRVAALAGRGRDRRQPADHRGGRPGRGRRGLRRPGRPRAALQDSRHAVGRSGPAGPDGAVGAGHVAAGGLHLLAVGVGLLVDHLEVAAQLGDELLTSRRPGAAPKVPGGKHIANDGLMLGFQRRGLRADGGAVGVDIAELVVDRHVSLLF